MAQNQTDRMPPIPADKLTDAQKRAIDEFKPARNADVSGPFVPMLRVARIPVAAVSSAASSSSRPSQRAETSAARSVARRYAWHWHRCSSSAAYSAVSLTA